MRTRRKMPVEVSSDMTSMHKGEIYSSRQIAMSEQTSIKSNKKIWKDNSLKIKRSFRNK